MDGSRPKKTLESHFKTTLKCTLLSVPELVSNVAIQLQILDTNDEPHPDLYIRSAWKCGDDEDQVCTYYEKYEIGIISIENYNVAKTYQYKI